MDKFEAQLVKTFQKSSFGRKASGKIEFDLDNGTIGSSGGLKGGILNKEMYAGDFFDSIDYDIVDKMLEVYNHSKALSDGPIYKCVIEVQKGQPKITFYWENKPIKSIDDIAPDMHGNIPTFAYRKHFSAELIEKSDKYALITGQPALVEELIRLDKKVPSHHMEIFALYDWISDTNNGGFGQYFAHKRSWDNTRLPRKDMYPLVRSALMKIEEPSTLALYDEAIALYAHFHDHVEQARRTLDIPPVAKQEESDIDSRYFQMLENLETKVYNYITSNKEIFAYH